MTKPELIEMLDGVSDDVVFLSKDATGVLGPAQFYPTTVHHDANHQTWRFCTDQTPMSERVKVVVL